MGGVGFGDSVTVGIVSEVVVSRGICAACDVVEGEGGSKSGNTPSPFPPGLEEKKRGQ